MSSDHDIIVVGGGIAGLTAGLTAARLGRTVLVLTGDTLGGHLLSIERIDGYPGFLDGAAGFDLCPTIQEQAAEAGALFAMETVTELRSRNGGWQVDSSGGSYQARALVLATGTRLRLLDVPGESLLRGKGVSQCASCDAPLLRGKAVVVAGGGDSALQEALTLAEHCSRVTLIHHGSEPSGQQAYRAMVDASDRITLIGNSEVTEILGDAAVTGVRFRPLDRDETNDLDCAAVFVFIGLTAGAALVDTTLLDADGFITTDDQLRTAQPGLFAAGTARAGAIARAASAAGEGSAAAIAADRYLDAGIWR